MNKLAILLLAIVASKGVFAGEVGAKSPQITESVTLAYVTTDLGASSANWAIGPVNPPATLAQQNRMIHVLNTLNKDISQKITLELERQFDAIQ